MDTPVYAASYRQQQQTINSYVEPSQNYNLYQTPSQNYYDDSGYDYSSSWVRSTAPPKKDPESVGWSTLLVVGTVAAIGYGLIKLFRR